MDTFSYAIGLGIAQNLRSMGASDISVDDFAQALRDLFEGRPLAMTHREAQQIAQRRFRELQAQAARVAQETGRRFLEENAKRPGVTTLPSGLQYEVLTQGTGRRAKATDRVKCHYQGMLTDGTVFDSSISRGEPAVFGVGQVIRGWVEALQLMPEGSKWKLFIPHQLAYGAQGAGDSIPPYSTLIFEVELLQVL